jgi:serine/threonine protein kinase
MIDDQHILALPNGYRLGKYCFKGVLGSGGFGITYLAEDTSLDRKVAIKEMLPNDFATRVDGTTVVAKTQTDKTNLDWARARFMDEGRALAACDHPNVIDVYEMIEANGTAYMVTQFQEGCNLEKWFQNLQRRPTQKELTDILLPLLAGLEKVHRAGFLHRDIKPENIYMTLDGRPVLLDFGSARQAVRGRSLVMTSIVTPGYAPFEQYHEDGNQGAWTDIYALGAVMYRGITGKKPPEAIRRVADDACEILAATYMGQYRTGFLNAIDQALKLKESERPQSVAAWRESLTSDSIRDPKTVGFTLGTQAHNQTADAERTRTQELQSNDTDETSKEKRSTLSEAILPFVLQHRGVVATAAVSLVAVSAGIVYIAWPRPEPNKNVVIVTPTPVIEKSPTPSPISSPTPSPHIAVVVPTPTPPDKKPDVIAPTPTPVITVVPPTPIPTPVVIATPSATATQIDPKLVGKWETKHFHKDGGPESWELEADGKYVFSGAQDETGMLTASDGKILESSSANQTQQITYRFVGEKLVTKTPDAVETIWVSTKKREDENGPSRKPTNRHRDEDPGKSRTPMWQQFLKNRPKLPWER